VKATVTQRWSLATCAHRCGRMDLLFDARQPCPPARPLAERQKLVPSDQRGGARQEDVLDVVEFKHRELLVILFPFG
jgi:hypothetical protein